MSSSQTVQSVDRALDILSIVAQEPQGVSLKGLSDLLGLKSTTVHNLARTLVLRGYLVKDGRPPVYRLGPMPFQLTLLCGDRQGVAERAVNGVAGDCPWASVLYSEGIGDAVVTLLRRGPDRPGILQRPRNEMLAPYSSATVLAFQAFCDVEHLTALRRRYPVDEFGRNYWVSERTLDGWLTKVREIGQCIPEVGDSKLLRIASPMFGPHGELMGILGASVPDATARQRRTLATAVRTAASERRIVTGSS